MIRFVAALDKNRGIADDHGIPWKGRIPGDSKYYRDLISKGGAILMGYGVYKEKTTPYEGGTNYVASRNTEKLRDGFTLVSDAREFQANSKEDVWNLGGAGLFASTIDQADELHLTQLDQAFDCTKFFPEYKDDFKLVSESEPHTENGITYTFQVWTRK